jgi:putative zinc finger protein
MGTCRQMQELMVAALYDDLDTRQQETLDRHLRSCSACAQDYRELQEAVRVMRERESPQRDEAFWASYFEQLAPRLESSAQQPRPSRPGRSPVWRPVFRLSAAAALVLAGILVGKWIWQKDLPESPSAPTVSVPHRDREKPMGPGHRAEAYFQESKVLLLALANFDPATDNAATLNFPTQRRISETLVQEAVYLKSQFTDTTEMRLRELVDDLEVILLQIANIESEHDLEAIEIVRSGVNRQGLLFRIDLSQLSDQSGNASLETPPETKSIPTI